LATGRRFVTFAWRAQSKPGGVNHRPGAKRILRADQIEAAWQVLLPVLERWAEASPRDFPNYAAGTWGPKAADELLARAGHCWRPVA
jgi:glucose-6-phosphate 1-dehydrogenase